MALTEKLQIRLSEAEKATIFRLAASRSLETGKRVSAADLLRGMVTKALAVQTKKAENEPEITDAELEAIG